MVERSSQTQGALAEGHSQSPAGAELQRGVARPEESMGQRPGLQASRAEEVLGPGLALANEQPYRAGGESRGTPAAALPGSQPVLSSVALLRSGKLEAAAEQLEQALKLCPQDFWANFYSGVCAYRRQRYDEAAQAFRVAIALAPASAECYYNRGLAHAACGKTSQALDDYTRALALAPGLGEAVLNRGILYYQQGHLHQARADLEQALAAKAEPATTHYNLALVAWARGDRAAAQDHLDQAGNHNPAHAGVQALRQRLRQDPPRPLR